MKYRTTRHRAEPGFTLVEMIVAVGLFAVVMVVCVAALLALVNANRKAQALQSVMNNLNIALDGMVRNIREGNEYNGSVSCDGNTGSAHDCTGGTTEFSFEPYGNQQSDPPWVYEFYCPTAFTTDGNGNEVCQSGGEIERSENGQSLVPITAPEISIQQMEFYVVGSQSGDTTQPKVLIVVKGTAGIPGSNMQTTFHIQATAVQRVLDL